MAEEPQQPSAEPKEEEVNQGELKKHPSRMKKHEVMLELAILKKDDPDICQWPKKWGDLTESLVEMRSRLLKHWKKRNIKCGEALFDWKDRSFGPSRNVASRARNYEKAKQLALKRKGLKQVKQEVVKPKVWRKDFEKSEVILIRHLLKWVPAKILEVDTD